MLALATSIKIRAKIDEKSHVFWDLDFDRILGGFWEGFGRPKSSIFAFFFDVFSMSFFKRGSEGEKIDQKCEKTKLFRFLASGLRWSPDSWGKERIGERTLQIEMLERMSRLASCDSAEPVGNQSRMPLAHLRWPADRNPPRGGPPPPTHLARSWLFLFIFLLRTDSELEVEAAIAQLEAGVRNQFQFFIENLAKIMPEPFQIESWDLQNRVRRPPRQNFYKTFKLRREK